VNTATARQVISTWVSSEDADVIRARAAAADRTVAAEVRRALREYLQNERTPGQTPGARENGEAAPHERE
jgi:plasmid stability protein